MNITVLRPAEMCLTRAEANQRTGGSAGRHTAQRRTASAHAGLGTECSDLDDILRERRNELIFEGVLHMDPAFNSARWA